jgi:hypothetical protein
MTTNTAIQIVTANHLMGGHSVYLSAGGWTGDISRARIALGAGEAAVLEALARAGEAANRVVGVYLVDVELDEDGCPDPVQYREKLRARAVPSFWAAGAAARGPRHHPAGREARHVPV